MIQPGIVTIGTQFFIKIEKRLLELRVPNALVAVGYLVVYYALLHVKYPEPVKLFICFLEYLFGFPEISTKSSVLKRLIDSL
jgi:hypothetical protein